MPTRARSLAEDLRARDDDALARLLQLRPDTLRPVPRSFADLALRANSGPGVVAALDDLTAAHLGVLEAACALAPAGRFAVADLARGLDTDPDAVEVVVADLYDRALLWGGGDDLRVPSAVRDAMGPYPCGLDTVVRENLPAVRLATDDPAAFSDRLALAPPAARDLLLAHIWGPPTLPDVPGRDWLADADFMATDEAGNVLVPREIALQLRRGLLALDPVLADPSAAAPPTQLHAADAPAAHAADQFLRDTDRVIQQLERVALGRQANGAFPVRDLDTLATAAGLPKEGVALILAVAHAAQWVDYDEDRLRPTTCYETEFPHAVADRWATLALAWYQMDRGVPREPARVLAAAPDPALPAVRCLVLTGLAAGAARDLTGWLAWFRPRADVTGATLAAVTADADALGLCFGGVAGAGARYLASGATEARELAAAIAPDLPELTDRLILQADLTATSLGPLHPGVERRLGDMAEWESGGAATVYRFTPAGIRRAVAQGIDATAFLDWLESLSATPVPQALGVLMADEGAATPTLTAHSAMTVLTGAADAIASLAADPSLAELGLREVAPGVIVSPVPLERVSHVLLDNGHQVALPPGSAPPVLPSGATAAGTAAPDPRRVVRSLRGVERGNPATDPAPPDLAPAGPAQIHDALARAAAGHGQLWLTFASEDGERITHLLEPLDLAAGDVCAFDHSAGEIRTIPLERIVAISSV